MSHRKRVGFAGAFTRRSDLLDRQRFAASATLGDKQIARPIIRKSAGDHIPRRQLNNIAGQPVDRWVIPAVRFRHFINNPQYAGCSPRFSASAAFVERFLQCTRSSVEIPNHDNACGKQILRGIRNAAKNRGKILKGRITYPQMHPPRRGFLCRKAVSPCFHARASPGGV